jgi:SAM-dependent methyltransferase
MTLLVPPRRHEPEWLDRTDNATPDVEGALKDIAWVNHRLGGARALLRGIDPFLQSTPPGSVCEILDIGTGGGDLAAAMVEHGRSRGLRVDVTAVDRDPAAAALAAREAPRGVRVLQADAFSLSFPRQSFDLVTASLFLHHFRPAEAAALLSIFRRLARRGVVINELRRHRIPWAFIAMAGRVTRRSPMFVHDAALSVLRGFTESELLALAADAGAPDAPVRRLWPYRLLLTLPPDPPEATA